MNNNHRPATFGERLLAALTDHFILSMINLLGYLYLVNASDMPDLLQRLFSALVLLFIPAIAFKIFYDVWFVNQFGATPGKQLWGLTVINADQKQFLSLKMAAFRELIAKSISRFSLGLGFFWIIFDKNNQGWHDQLAGTNVIKNTTKSAILGPISLLIILSLNGLLWFSIISSTPNLLQVIMDWIAA